MPLPEGYLPREGDILALHAIVKYNGDSGDDRVHVKVKGHYETTSIKLSEIVDLIGALLGG